MLLLLPGGGEDSVSVGGGGVVKLPDRIPLVALTFDDGPRPDTTGALLEGLALREVPATFFLVGERIKGCEELLRSMKTDGHQIGIHTYNHVLMTQLNRAEFREQLGRTRAALAAVLGEGDYWLRPPYGIVNGDVLRWADGPLILWSVDPEDWKDRNEERIVAEALAQVEDGAILLLHDIYPSSVRAALRIVDGLLERGYCFVTVEQLMEARGVEPKAGKLYLSLPPE
jgi:peptidoglycan/xylan/chitin deacetylase (PgdA/CDA1 family)